MAESTDGKVIDENVSIIDSTGKTWTLVSSASNGLQISMDGSISGAFVTLLLYWNKTVYQRNKNGDWWKWMNNSWMSTSDPRATPATIESPQGSTFSKSTDPAIIDSKNAAWTIDTSGVLNVNNIPDTNTASVILLVYWDHTVYQQNNAKGWWKWVNNAWVSTTDPRASAGVPPISSGLPTITIDPTITTNISVPDTIYGVGTSALFDNNAALATNATFQATAKTLNFSLLRSNWHQGRGSMMDKIFPSKTSAPNWSVINPYLTNLPKWTNISKLRQLVSIGFPGWVNTSNASDRVAWAQQCVQVAKHFSDMGAACSYWEMMNEQDSMNINDACSMFNALSSAMKSYNADYKIGGLTDSYAHQDRFTLFVKGCKPDFLSYHWYGVLDDINIQRGNNNAKVMANAINSVTRAKDLRTYTSAAGYPPSNPIFLGEYNIDGYWYNGGPKDYFSGGIMTKYINAVATALVTYNHIASNVNVTMAALWGLVNDSDYGIINSTRISPTGYFLSKAISCMPGMVIKTTIPNLANLSVIATKPNSGNFAVQIINYDPTANRNISLNVPNVKSDPITYWEIGSAQQTTPLNKRITPADLVSLSIPPMSVVMISQ